MSEGVAEVETADGSDENAKCGDQQNLHDVFSFTSAFAAVRTLPTPGPSGYVDRESSVVVAFPTGARGSALNGGVWVVWFCEVMV